MRITVLVDNISNQGTLESEHGLSLYIETKGHKVLFDTGASDLFFQNAVKMGIDLSQIDTAIISHGHDDHGGGLKEFLSINDKAKIYVRKQAFDPHYSKKNGVIESIGLDRSLLDDERFIFTDDRHYIDAELLLFSEDNPQPNSGSQHLLMEVEGSYVPDQFFHEQNLWIMEEELKVLVTGCAHGGIANILEQERQMGLEPNYVIGGFHLSKAKADELQEVADYMKGTTAVFYTGHCTGYQSYEFLREQLGDRINYAAVGEWLQFTK